MTATAVIEVGSCSPEHWSLEWEKYEDEDGFQHRYSYTYVPEEHVILGVRVRMNYPTYDDALRAAKDFIKIQQRTETTVVRLRITDPDTNSFLITPWEPCDEVLLHLAK